MAAPEHAEEEAGYELRGAVTFKAGRDQQISRLDFTDTLVYYIPAGGAPRPKAGRYEIYTINRDFKPGALAVPFGSTVSFVNQDDVRHNVFSVTPRAAFNLGLQAPAQTARHVFATPGLVLISCNVHKSMEAEVLVVPTPYAAKVGADGRFVLRGLPAGAGKLYFWNPRAAQAVQAVRVPSAAPLSQALIANRPRVATQLNLGSAP